MININNKPWNQIQSKDIESFINGTEEENFFFEFKSDDEKPEKLIKEISAFANTYGGYVFLGIDDDKHISGCDKWNEQRVHSTIHDSITPIPNFDVRSFEIKDKRIIVIKIEEGALPPYITNKGQIFERVSSGSFPIKESYKLTQLYNKREDQIKKIHNVLDIKEIPSDENLPNNFCGYFDFGFSLVTSEPTHFQNDFFNIDLNPVIKYPRIVK